MKHLSIDSKMSCCSCKITWTKIYCAFLLTSVSFVLFMSQLKQIKLFIAEMIGDMNYRPAQGFPNVLDTICANEVRLHELHKSCSVKQWNKDLDVNNYEDIKKLDNLWIHEAERVIYCFLSKVPCSTMLALSQVNDIIPVTHREAKDETYWRQYGLNKMSAYKEDEIIHRLENFHKVIVVGNVQLWLSGFEVQNYNEYLCLPDEELATALDTIYNVQNMTTDNFLALMSRNALYWKRGFEQCVPCQLKYNQVMKMNTWSQDIGLLEYYRPSLLTKIRHKYLALQVNYMVSPSSESPEISESNKEEIRELFTKNFELFGDKWEAGQGIKCQQMTSCGPFYDCI